MIVHFILQWKFQLKSNKSSLTSINLLLELFNMKLSSIRDISNRLIAISVIFNCAIVAIISYILQIIIARENCNTEKR